MLKKIAFYIIFATVASVFVACNEETEDPTTTSSNVMVSSFSLVANDSLLVNLDSVFFSIDLVNAKIYNADSLPYGTDVSHLVAKISTMGSSIAELHIPRPGKSDSIIDYLKRPNDSIDFSNGPVIFHIVALDKSTQRDYSISVNVHKVKPDSLYWNKLSKNKLPSLLNNPSVQKTITYKGDAVCISGIHPQYTLATISNPSNFVWDMQEISFPFVPNINSLSATDDALYLLDNDGNLYSSTDGLSWTACNETWHHIYGGYNNILLGVKNIDGKYYHVTYPASSTTLADEKCPISGTSQIVNYNNNWSVSHQAFLIGGRCADGSTTGEMWGYDGNNWSQISLKGIYPREDMTFFAYYTFDTNTNNWTITKYPTLVAFGGFDAEGKPGRNVFISIDMGLNWKLADDLMQLPEYIPNMGGAQALVFDRTMTARSTSGWVEYPSKSLPYWWEISNPINSRASQNTNTWECPYIYLFGGYDENGNLYNTIWRGVINRLSFKPVI